MVFEKTWRSRVVKIETYGSFTCVTLLGEFVELYKVSLSLYLSIFICTWLYMYMSIGICEDMYTRCFSIYIYIVSKDYISSYDMYVHIYIYIRMCIYIHIMYIYRLALSIWNHWWAAKLSSFVNHMRGCFSVDWLLPKFQSHLMG